MRRFAAWLALPELGPPVEVPSVRSVDLAVEDGDWRGIAVFIGEQEGWTVFQDMTGYLAATPIAEWLRLAGDDELVFAGYNDAIWWAELIVLKRGQVIREFREAAEAPEENTNSGRLEFEAESLSRVGVMWRPSWMMTSWDTNRIMAFSGNSSARHGTRSNCRIAQAKPPALPGPFSDD